MSKKRKQYSASFKSKVALAALKGDQTTSEIAARFQIHLGRLQECNNAAHQGNDHHDGKQDDDDDEDDDGEDS